MHLHREKGPIIKYEWLIFSLLLPQKLSGGDRFYKEFPSWPLDRTNFLEYIWKWRNQSWELRQNLRILASDREILNYKNFIWNFI